MKTRIPASDLAALRLALSKMHVNEREFFALVAGAKPSQRDMVAVRHASVLAKLYGRYNLAVRFSEQAVNFESGLMAATVPGPRSGRVVFYASPDAATAQRLKDVEGETLKGIGDHAVNTRVMGEALGYPACCIDAFFEHHHRTPPEFNMSVVRRSSPRAPAELNFLEPHGWSSHIPCTLQCEPSVQIARQLNASQPQPMSRDQMSGEYLLFRTGQWFAIRVASATSDEIVFDCLKASGPDVSRGDIGVQPTIRVPHEAILRGGVLSCAVLGERGVDWAHLVFE